MKTYIGAFLLSMFISALATPLVVRWAARVGALDSPGGRRIHSKVMPRLGGLAILMGFMGTAIAIWFLGNQVSNLIYQDTFRLLMVLAAAVTMLAVGSIDDIRGLAAKHKLLVEIVLALVLCALDIRITYLQLPGVFEIHFGLWSWPLTVLWIVGITNAMNLVDGLDGLAAGIAAIACAPIAVFAIASGQMLAACVMLSLLGALLGFLIYNFNPAKIFLGDSGSLFIGFLLASTSVYCSIKAPLAVGLAAPLLALGVPLFDTFSSIIRRFLERRSIFCPDSGHLHHRLIQLGLTQRRAVLLMYAATLAAAAAGMVMVFAKQSSAVPLFAGGIIVLVVFFRLHGGLRIRRNLTLIKSNLDRQRELRRTKRISDNLQVRVSHVSSVNELWTLFEDLAQQFDLNVLELQLPHLSQSTDYYRYQLPSPQIPPEAPCDNLTVRIPFRLGTTGPDGELYAEVPIHGNAEAAAGKVQHLSRLMDCVCARPLFPAEQPEPFDTPIPQEVQTPEVISVG
ncbi:MAG: hypothetical protein GWP14_02635 [Actinobacteria bacterium]|nr:hypothetical protein [Actinomycetota bacterium]